MKTKSVLVLFAALFAFSGFAADSNNRLQFPAAGFSITPLDAAPGSAQQATIMMFLPESSNFAANVNVMIQAFSGTLDEYATNTVQQFKDNNMKLLEQKKVGKSATTFEYTGPMQGTQLHWYARAEKCGTNIYLTTATGLDSDWTKQSAKLKACVDSFKCDAGK